MYTDGNITSYIVTDNNNVIVLKGGRDSFRCRQRSESTHYKPFRFISYKGMCKEFKKKSSKIYGPFTFDSKSRL